MSSGERKRRRLNLLCVIVGGRCTRGVVGLDRTPSAGGVHVCVRVGESFGKANRSA